MKSRLLMIMLFALLQTFTFAQISGFEKLIGKWEAVDAENQSGGIEIIDSSKIFLVYGSEKKSVSAYKADFKKSPIWFDFTIDDGSEKIILKSLIHIINDNLLQWQVFNGDAARPAHFTEDKGEIIYLRRKKE